MSTKTWGAGSALRFRYRVPKISPERLPKDGLGGSSKEAPCARAEGVSVSDASVKKENKRKKEPVRRFNFQACPIMFRHLDVLGWLESSFCDCVLQNANAISCGEISESLGNRSLVTQERRLARANSPAQQIWPIPSAKLRELSSNGSSASCPGPGDQGEASSAALYQSAANAGPAEAVESPRAAVRPFLPHCQPSHTRTVARGASSVPNGERIVLGF